MNAFSQVSVVSSSLEALAFLNLPKPNKMNTNHHPDNLDPSKLFTEDTIRALLPHELWTYQDGKLLVSMEGLACLCIGVLEGKLEGDKVNAQRLLDLTGIKNPFAE